MAETQTAPVQPKRRRWLRRLAYVFGGLFVLLVVAYFVVTSGAFFKGVILPRIGAAINARVTVSDASISPFSQVVLRDLQVQPNGAEPLVTAKEVRLRYSLMAILRGTMKADEVVLESPVVQVIQKADGTWNFDPILKATSQGKKSETPPKAAASSPPLLVDLKKLAINNATLTFTQFATNGTKTVAELPALNPLNLVVLDVKNGQTARINLGTGFKFSAGTPKDSSTVSGSVRSAFQADLGADLMPKQIKGDTDLAIPTATGAFADAAGLVAKLNADLGLTDIKQFAINFARADKPLGTITVAGPFEALKQEGKLKVEVSGIGNEVLSLVGGRFGILFGSTKLAANYEIELKNQAQQVNTTGSLTCNQFSLTRSNLTTPVLDFQIGYSMAIDRPKTNALIHNFAFNVTQAGRPLLKAATTKEMLLDWGKGAQAVADSSLELTVNELNLADWRAFLGTNLTAGVVNGKLNVNVQQAGKQIAFDLASQLSGLAAQFESNHLDHADVKLALRGQVSDFTKIGLAGFDLSVVQSGQKVMALTSSGQFDMQTQDADMQAELDAALPQLTALALLPNIALSAGHVNFTGHITQKNLTPAQTNNPSMEGAVTGNLRVADLTGQIASNRFDRFESAVDLDVALKNQLAEIRKCTGALKQAGQDGGSFEASGNFNLTNKTGQVVLKLADLNQNTLRSFVAAALGDKTLASISLNANVGARYDPKNDSGVQGDFQIANLLITDPKGQLPKVPLTAMAKLDAGLSAKGLATLRQCSGNVRQGEQPGGTFDASGHYDITNQTGQFTLKLADLNQNALRPLLASALGDKTLESVSISANTSARYDAKAGSSVKADLQVTNLVVNDPSGKLPKTPLAAGLVLDGACANQLLDLKQAQLTLSPTERAKNQLQLAGKVDLAKSNAITGNLKLTADSLDVTRYYDLFAGQTAPATNTTASTKPVASSAPAAPPKPAAEPLPVILPLQQFVFDANIGKFYLREIAVINLLATAKIDGGKVDVNPFQLTLNGAPVNAAMSLDRSVPGYRYDGTFNADRIPVEPLANSFSPDYRGQAKGELFAKLQIKGAGMLDADFQKNLSGAFGLTFTNANIHLAPGKLRTILTVIALALRQTDITKAPLNWVNLQGKMGAGKINFDQFSMVSDYYAADTAGEITLATVLTNSLINDWPVNFALKRSFAEKASLVPANAPTNTVYVALPRFVKVGGTIGAPDAKIDKLVVLGIVTKSVSGLDKVIGKDAGKVLGTVGGLLTGDKSSSTNKTDGSQTTTNKPAPFNPFKALDKLLPR